MNWIILWETCSFSRRDSFLCSIHHNLETMYSQCVCSVPERCSRERQRHPKLRSNRIKETLLSHIQRTSIKTKSQQQKLCCTTLHTDTHFQSKQKQNDSKAVDSPPLNPHFNTFKSLKIKKES